MPYEDVDSDDVLSEAEAALDLGISVRTLQNWRRQGRGPRYLKLGDLVKYTPRLLREFKNASTVSNTKEGITLARSRLGRGVA
jgi:hypothetical protein